MHRYRLHDPPCEEPQKECESGLRGEELPDALTKSSTDYF